MALFEPITLGWQGKEYTIAPDRILRLIAQVESELTYAELYQFSIRGGAPLAKLSMSFGLMLRYAGAKVTDEEIYNQLLTGGAEEILSITQSLLAMMTPPQHLVGKPEEGHETEAGKQESAESP